MIFGRVMAWDAGTRLAVVDGVAGQVQVLRHVSSILVGDTGVVMVDAGRAVLTGVLAGSLPPAGETAPEISGGDGVDSGAPSAPPSTAKPIPLRPTFSGSFRAGSWRTDTSDLYQGDWTGRGINSGGCWWGKLPASLSAATLTLVRSSAAGSGAALAPTLTLLAGTSRPAGAPSVLASVAGPALLRGKSAPWPVPGAWLALMAAGTAGGIGCTSGASTSPYLALVASGVGMTLAVTS